VTVAATRNNVRVIGPSDAVPLVFAHGFGCDQEMWRFVAPRFADAYQVVTFDHVGAGGADLSCFDPAAYSSLSRYAADLVELCDELELHDIVFVGHSVSAMIGALAANRRPDLFGALVMVGPSPRYLDDEGYRGGFTEQDIDELLASLEGNFLGWSGAMAPVIMGNPDQPALGMELEASFCRTDPVAAATFARATFLSDNRADLANISCPTLVLQCAEDVIAPDEVGVYVADAIPDGTLVRLRATGHCPHLSSPDETYQAIREFIDGLRARP
jgi:sigma-B regulation protein RsbQ